MLIIIKGLHSETVPTPFKTHYQLLSKLNFLNNLYKSVTSQKLGFVKSDKMTKYSTLHLGFGLFIVCKFYLKKIEKQGEWMAR